MLPGGGHLCRAGVGIAPPRPVVRLSPATTDTSHATLLPLPPLTSDNSVRVVYLHARARTFDSPASRGLQQQARRVRLVPEPSLRRISASRFAPVMGILVHSRAPVLLLVNLTASIPPRPFSRCKFLFSRSLSLRSSPDQVSSWRSDPIGRELYRIDLARCVELHRRRSSRAERG